MKEAEIFISLCRRGKKCGWSEQLIIYFFPSCHLPHSKTTFQKLNEVLLNVFFRNIVKLLFKKKKKRNIYNRSVNKHKNYTQMENNIYQAYTTTWKISPTTINKTNEIRTKIHSACIQLQETRENFFGIMFFLLLECFVRNLFRSCIFVCFTARCIYGCI